jgi:hypothetical protein
MYFTPPFKLGILRYRTRLNPKNLKRRFYLGDIDVCWGITIRRKKKK